MAQAGPQASQSYIETMATTRTPNPPALPTGLDNQNTAFQFPQNSIIPGDGLRLAGLFSVVVSVYAPVGQTLTSGNLRCVIYNPFMQRWTFAPAFDIDLSNAAGKNAYTYGALKNISRLGMLMNFLSDTVVMSGGPWLQVRQDGFESTGPRGT